MPESKDEEREGLTEKKKEILRETWSIVSQPSVQAGSKLFKTLFQLAPDAAGYFTSVELNGHIKLVMGTLGEAIDNLDDLSVMVPRLQRLGTTHASLGVKAQHFKYVKQALLQTLSQELQDTFTDDCEEAWALAFDVIAGAMISGMFNNNM